MAWTDKEKQEFTKQLKRFKGLRIAELERWSKALFEPVKACKGSKFKVQVNGMCGTRYKECIFDALLSWYRGITHYTMSMTHAESAYKMSPAEAENLYKKKVIPLQLKIPAGFSSKEDIDAFIAEARSRCDKIIDKCIEWLKTCPVEDAGK